MDFLVRAIHWVFGNGYDLSVDEDTVVRHKAQAKACLAESEAHFYTIREKLDDVTPDPDAGEDSFDEHPSQDRLYNRRRYDRRR